MAAAFGAKEGVTTEAPRTQRKSSVTSVSLWFRFVKNFLDILPVSRATLKES